MKNETGEIGLIVLLIASIFAGVTTNVISSKITEPAASRRFEVYDRSPIHVQKCFETTGTINKHTVCVDEEAGA